VQIGTSDYIVVIISSDKEAEKNLLHCLSKDASMSWKKVCYIAMGSCSDKIMSITNDNHKDLSNCLFFLINPSCLDKTGNHKECANKIQSLFETIKDKKKEIILLLHDGDTIKNNNLLAALVKPPEKFHHSNNVKDIDSNTPSEIFMFKVCERDQNNFQEEFIKLIEALLKQRPIANTILHLFLPLDIDLQALWNCRDSDKEAYWNEMLKSRQLPTYEDRFAKLIEASAGIIESSIPNVIDGKDILTFFKKLDSKDITFTKMENDGYKVTKKENDPNISPFHRWFCDVASYLKGRKVLAECD